MYSQNCQPVKNLDFSCNPMIVNNVADVKSRAYINPNILRYPFCLANSGSFTVSKHIHINPNFKGTSINYLLSKNGTVSESESYANCLHISRPLVNTSTHQNEQKRRMLSVDLTEKTHENHEFNRKLSHNKKSSSNKFRSFENTFSTSSCNSTYFWSKDNKAPINVPVHFSESVVLPSPVSHLHSTSKSYKNVKTKHKIVNNSNFAYKMDKEKTCQYRLLNRYKIINVENPAFNAAAGSKSYPSFKRINMSPSTEINSTIIQSKEDSSTNIIQCKKHHPGKNLQQPKQNAFKSNKNLCVNRITNLIKTKYILQNRSLLYKKKEQKLLQQELVKYKLDKRKKNLYNIKRKINLKMASDDMKLLPKKVQTLKVMTSTWKGTHSRHLGFKSDHHIWRRQLSSDKELQRITRSYTNKTVVNIGGILYKATTNKLTRTKHEDHVLQSTEHFSLESTLKGKKHHIVHVRGEKFLLDVNGKTLIRQPGAVNVDTAQKSTIKRVDIGGVTYIQKSNNILIQTNTHEARQLVHSAKQRSIVLLHNLHKRNNKPCMIYQRFGVCRRFNKGICIYIHDPKNIALCKRFLKGECHNSLCPLSHNKIEEKIATCHFFLKGKCNREKCPFLHVKVNKKAVICRNFLQGFCVLGQNCTKRHVHQCPDLDEKGVCSRGIKCPYPHKICSKRKRRNSRGYNMNELKVKKKVLIGMGVKQDFTVSSELGKSSQGNSGLGGKSASKVNQKIRLRKRKTKKNKEQDVASQELRNDSVLECIPKRIKLDDLPLFIPLDPK